MIVPMKKVSLVVQQKDAVDTVAALRALGVVHVEHQRLPAGQGVEACGRDLELLEEALRVLSKDVFSKGVRPPAAAEAAAPSTSSGRSGSRPKGNKEGAADMPSGFDGRRAALHVIAVAKRYEHLQEFSHQLRVRIAAWQDWGDFDPAAVKALREHGVFVRLYAVPAREVTRLSGEGVCRVLFTSRGVAHCVVVSRREEAALPFKEIELPDMNLGQMRDRLEEDLRVMDVLVAEVRSLARHKACFASRKALVDRELEFARAVSGMGQAGPLTYLVGYAPADEIERLTAAARQQAWGMLVAEPSEEDRVPTLVRNPRWPSWIQPLMRFLEILPGYTEWDCSPLFLIFFSLFFGIIIGDAAYGLLYLAATFFLQRTFGDRVQDQKIFPLMYLLSSCAIVWGVLTGTFFGQAWLAARGIRALVPPLNDPRFLQGLCFFIGATHLSLAHLWRFALRWPSSTAWAELGWVSILWAAFFLARLLLLDAAFPFFGKYLIVIGISLVVFFSNPRKNIFARIGAGLGTIALSLMNTFGDVVSYVRLFAVGLAGVAISDAFTAMAQGTAVSGIMGFIAAGLILVAGHLLNFVLSPMSVLVHGVRLNVLEFSGHAGITWAGVPYKPLAEQ